MNMREILFSKLANIYFGSLKRVLLDVRDVILPELENIISSFFKEVKEVEELQPLLKNDKVIQNLESAMRIWWVKLFEPHDVPTVKAFIARQLEIAGKHADLNINLHYVHHGVRIFKREIHSRMENHTTDWEQLSSMTYVLDELLDIIVSLMSDSYFQNLVKYESDTLSIRMNAQSQNVAIECERVRSMLFDWTKSIVIQLFQNEKVNPDTLTYAEYSSVGMWVAHKANLLLPEQTMVDKLHQHLRWIDIELSQTAILRAAGNLAKSVVKLQAFDSRVNQMAWYLSTIIEQVIKLDAGRDALTTLYNRRYLGMVLRRETEISMKQGHPYAVLLMDIDFFKKVNDQYGHDAGDVVLKQFSELLIGALRISDFVFRFGGEEFLAALGNTTGPQAMMVAEKIRLACESHVFAINKGQALSITCSIGVSIYKGHPDYHAVIKQADVALYEAKRSGRNRCVMGS